MDAELILLKFDIQDRSKELIDACKILKDNPQLQSSLRKAPSRTWLKKDKLHKWGVEGGRSSLTSCKLSQENARNKLLGAAGGDISTDNLRGVYSPARRESCFSEEDRLAGQRQNLPQASNQRPQLSNAEGPPSAQHGGDQEDQPLPPEDGLVRWWDAIDAVGPEEFAKRASTALQEQNVRHSRYKNRRRRIAELPTQIHEIVKQMEKLAEDCTGQIPLPQLPKKQLKQVEILASMFHLELRTFQQGGDGQKALSVTEQTAPLSTGGRLQMKQFFETHRLASMEAAMRPSRRANQPRHSYTIPEGDSVALAREARAGKPVPPSSKGGQMLQALGWREGQGIGAQQQGMLEPLLPEKRKRFAGLGIE